MTGGLTPPRFLPVGVLPPPAPPPSFINYFLRVHKSCTLNNNLNYKGAKMLPAALSLPSCSLSKSLHLSDHLHHYAQPPLVV